MHTAHRFADFQQIVMDYYRAKGRHDLPWRQPLADGSFDPYSILVSEIMLQQTQVARVLPKFTTFTMQFPSIAALAAAPLGEVLKAWSGLGYNRRAKFLWQAAQQVMATHHGRLPDTLSELVCLPGVGTNTAGAVLAYAFNKPVVFIETNIRTVFIHHFFANEPAVPDRAISDIVAATVPDDPREWYWALMDYGTHLKQIVGNVSQRSKHYTKQSTFVGSKRQIRGRVLQLLAEGSRKTTELAGEIQDDRLDLVLADLVREGLITEHAGQYKL